MENKHYPPCVRLQGENFGIKKWGMLTDPSRVERSSNSIEGGGGRGRVKKARSAPRISWSVFFVASVRYQKTSEEQYVTYVWHHKLNDGH